VPGERENHRLSLLDAADGHAGPELVPQSGRCRAQSPATRLFAGDDGSTSFQAPAFTPFPPRLARFAPKQRHRGGWTQDEHRAVHGARK